MRYVLLLIVLIFTSSCSRPDFDTSVQVQAWLESLDPNAEVIEVRCTGDVEEPPGSGAWKEWDQTDRWPAKDVLAVYANRGLDWAEIVARAISASQEDFPRAALARASEGLTAMQRLALKMNFRIENVRCEGKPLRSPPAIQVGQCPNDVDGCDEPPMTTDLPPPLPPPPSPSG